MAEATTNTTEAASEYLENIGQLNRALDHFLTLYQHFTARLARQ